MLKISFSLSILFVSVLSVYASSVSKDDCLKKGENFIFAGNECIEYRAYKGEIENKLNIIVHGTWEEGTNTLGRYAPFAENISFQTDISTIAIALPGYSNSSTNNFPALSNKKIKNLSSNKKYIEFLGELIKALKNKYKTETITYIGHSAGCTMGANLTALKPKLINNILCVGGNYKSYKKSEEKGLVSIVDVLDNVNKNIKFVLVYGTKDNISKPKVTKDFYKLAKTKGLNVKLVEVKDAPHLDLDMSDTSVNALINLVEEK